MRPGLVLVIAASACATAGPPQATGDDGGGDDAPPIDAPPGCTMQAFYRDADHDGHGDRTNAVMACTAPTDMVPNSDDCDDTSDQRFPGNAEVCDGLDNDCNATTADTCPGGCTIVRRPPPDNLARVYLVCNLLQSWTTARTTCANAGFGLVQIDDAAENSFVRQIADATFGNVDIHIGGFDSPAEGQWRWDSGDVFWSGGPGGVPVGGRYFAWRAGEPNDDGTEDCAEMKPEGGWNDDSCGTGQKFICRR